MKTYSINLMMGDPYADGHGKSEVTMIESNLNVKDLLKAFKAGSKKIGVDFDEIASDYEEDKLTNEDHDKFVAHGFSFDKVSEFDWTDEDDEYYALRLDTDLFAELYLFCVKVGRPDFEYKVIRSKNNIDIGGYGLFWG